MLQRPALHSATGRLDTVHFFFFFQGRLEDIQQVLNTTEISLHQLTALVDCRSLHMVRGQEREGPVRLAQRTAID